MIVQTIPLTRVQPLNRRGRTRRLGRIPHDALQFTVLAESFGERLKRLRLAAGLTQAQFAEAAHCERKMMWHYERDASRPPAETLARFADALGTTMDYLFRAKGEAS